MPVDSSQDLLNTAINDRLCRLTPFDKHSIIPSVEPTVRVESSAFSHRRLLLDGVRLKRRLPDHPRERKGRRNIVASRESNSKEVTDMDILTIIGSICSIVGLAFAIYVYIKSKNEKK